MTPAEQLIALETAARRLVGPERWTSTPFGLAEKLDELREKLDQLVLMVAATTGVALRQNDALEYATGALKELSDLRAPPTMTAPEYAAHYTMGRAPYVQGERGADY